MTGRRFLTFARTIERLRSVDAAFLRRGKPGKQLDAFLLSGPVSVPFSLVDLKRCLVGKYDELSTQDV